MTETNEKKELQVRPLGAGDLFTLAKILGKVGKDALSRIAEVNEQYKEQEQEAGKIKDEKQREQVLKSVEDAKQQSLGFVLLQLGLEKAEEHLKGFMASLVGMKDNLEEFDKLPLDAPLDIILELSDRKDFRDFLDKALKLSKNFMTK